jgi:hypothetical protein
MADHEHTTDKPPIPCHRCGTPVRRPVWLDQNQFTKTWCQAGKPSELSGERHAFHPVCAELARGGGTLE